MEKRQVRLIYCIASLLLFLNPCYAQRDGGNTIGAYLINVDPLNKVFQENGQPLEQDETIRHVARGEKATFQVVLQTKEAISGLEVQKPSFSDGRRTLSNAQVKYVGYVQVPHAIDAPMSVLKSSSRLFPDPLLEVPVKNVPANRNQPIWLTIDVPRTTVPGTYKANFAVSLHTKGGIIKLTKELQIKVYKAQLPLVQRLKVSTWWNSSGSLFKGFSKNTDIVTEIANMQAAYNHNMTMINVLYLTDFTKNGANYTFDFTKVDRVVDKFLATGKFKYFEAIFISKAVGGWGKEFQLILPKKVNGSLQYPSVAVNNTEAHQFYQQFFRAFTAHLKSRGLLSAFYQHAGDEPMYANFKSYNQVVDLIRQWAPELKIMDAVQTSQVSRNLDVVVPILDNFAKEYNGYAPVSRQRTRELWMYTCWAPQGNYANRLIELPLIKTRYLFWINYKYGLTGFLHWGFNQWSGNPLQTADKNAGDGWIVYPENGKIISSIRFEAMRDGINDYELLQQLGQRNPSLAKSSVNKMIKGFDSYNLDVAAFRATKQRILEALSAR